MFNVKMNVTENIEHVEICGTMLKKEYSKFPNITVEKQNNLDFIKNKIFFAINCN